MPADPKQLCPICSAEQCEPLLHRAGVPVHQNFLFPSAATARAIARGTLDFRACSRCRFIFNAAFDARLLQYGSRYENTQTHSEAFRCYMDELVTRLVDQHGVHAGTVLEVGCGKGAFLRKLLRWPGSTAVAVGYDPAYVGPRVDLDERIRFVRDFYRPETAVPADVVVCRHVIEHVANPLALLRSIRASLGGCRRTKVFVETPCVEWILQHEVSWDFFYEHCSLFTKDSLGAALTAAGFHVMAIKHVFGGQYLWAEATSEDGEWPPPLDDAFQALAGRFRQRNNERVQEWRNLVHDLHVQGSVAVWGAGAKGVTFCNLTDPQGKLISAVVDVNPAKQRMYLAGTGHRIVSPRQAVAERVNTILVLNSQYAAEIADSLHGLGAPARILDLGTGAVHPANLPAAKPRAAAVASAKKVPNPGFLQPIDMPPVDSSGV